MELFCCRGNLPLIIILLTLLLTVVKCQEVPTVESKEAYLKRIQTEGSEFNCLKGCVRPISTRLGLGEEPNTFGPDPRTVGPCADRPISPDCKSRIDAKTTLVQVHDEKFFFSSNANANKMTWHAALRTCRMMGLQLASIDSVAMNNKLINSVAKPPVHSGPFWTSGYTVSASDQVWVELGVPVVWPPGTAGKRAAGTCISITMDPKPPKWQEEPCSKANFYACEVPDECFTTRCNP